MNRFYPLARELTDLTEVQIKILEHMQSALQFAADMTRNQVFIFAKGKNDGIVSVLCMAKPSYASGEPLYEPGETYLSKELPLIDSVLSEGRKVVGRKELDLGKMADMTAYPIVDSAGIPFAAVSFTANSSKQQQVLTDTADMALHVPLEEEPYYNPRSQDGLIIFDAVGRVLYANDMANDLYFVLAKEAAARNEKATRPIARFSLMEKIMETGRAAYGEETAGDMTVSAWGLPIMSSGRIIRTVLILTDITAIREKERQILVKDSVIQEIHHRVKNSLNTIAGMLRMQARRTKDEETRAALKRAVGRIMGISQIHDILARQSGDRADWILLLDTLCRLSVESLSLGSVVVEKRFGEESMIVHADKALPLAIATNEVIHNALRHGFAGKKNGRLIVSTGWKGNDLYVRVENDGNQLPISMTDEDFGLGLQIVKTLAEVELGGRFVLRNEGAAVAADMVCPKEVLGAEA